MTKEPLRAGPWAVPMLGSLVPFTAFTFVPEGQRMIVGGVALLMVAWSLVVLVRQG